MINIISSSSSGNCIIYNDIMLDCGVPYSKTKQHLKDVRYIFISHSHTDHLNKSAIKRIAFEKPNIKFICGELLAEKLIDAGVEKRNINPLKLDYEYRIGDYKFKVNFLYHDVPNYCLHIEDKQGFKTIYIVDTSKVDSIKAENYDFAFIEGNYGTDEELYEKIKTASEEGRYTHYNRVLKTHLSQLQALNWLQKNNVKDYMFIHEHKEKENENNK